MFNSDVCKQMDIDIPALGGMIPKFEKALTNYSNEGDGGNQNQDLQTAEGKQKAFKKLLHDFELIAQYFHVIQTSMRDLLTETLSEQWGNNDDEKATKSTKSTTRKRVRSSAKKSDVTTKVETTHLLCKAQNLINDIYNEYFGLVDTLIEETTFPPSNFHTFGTLIFDLFLQDSEEISSYEKDAALAARYDLSLIHI